MNKNETLVWAKKDAQKKAEELLERGLNLSELAIIQDAVTLEEVPSKFDQVMQMNLPAPQYKEPQVKTYDPKIGHTLTGPLTIPEGTDLKKVEVTGTYMPKDEYALTTKLTANDITAFTVAPQFLCLPVFNTMVKIPMNDRILRENMIERGIDFISDLMEIDGVKEVLEKYGAEIKPL